MKKCHFYQNEVRFLGFVVLAQGISIEEERIKVVKAWLKPKSIRDIQVFFGFANFYRRFIQGFSKIAVPFTSMLKTTSTELPPKATDYFDFLSLEAKLAFFRLKQAFTEAPIFYHSDSKSYIRIETNTFGYFIGSILSQLTPESVKWHPVAIFSSVKVDKLLAS